MKVQKEVLEMKNQSNFVTLERAAEILGLSPGTMYQYTHRRIIPFYKPNGRMIYFKVSELMEFIESSRRSSVDEIKSQAVEDTLKRG
ncbi:MAG: helix-turn-helix domain-containing protein [Candidatus Cloacimonetes bacterium]|nr:helix-turn-helix domain-containing protein [Candidatus Cloacimonadota bacterium]